MVVVNNTNCVDRHSRPGVLEKVLLRSYFISNGAYTDPHAISGVAIFTRTQNSSPCSVLSSANEVTATPRMFFGNSATLVTDSIFDVSNYTPGNSASGIVKLNTGEYACVLDGTNDLTSWWNDEPINNICSVVGNYIDVWIVKLTAGSDWTVLINTFDLFSQTFLTITEPLIIRTNSKLANREVTLNSKVDLVVYNDFTIGNKGIDLALQNIMMDSVITNPSIKIIKKNSGNNLPDYIVSSFADTSASINQTGDNTLLFSWDTRELSNIASNSSGAFGNIVGTYAVQVEFTVLNQIIRTVEMPLLVRL